MGGGLSATLAARHRRAGVSLQAPSLQVGGATRIESRSEHKPGNGACPCPQRQDDQVAAAFGGARAARSSVRARMRPRWIWASNAGTVAVPKNCAMVAKPRQTAHPLCHGRRLPLRKGESLPLRRRGAGHRGFPQLNKHMGAQAKPGPGMTRGGSGRWAECQSLCGLVQDLFLSRVPHCTAVRRFRMRCALSRMRLPNLRPRPPTAESGRVHRNQLYLKMQYIARKPSFQPIFFPSS